MGDCPAERAVRLNALFESGHAVDIVLVVLAIEYGWLTARGRWSPVDAALRLGPGAMMLLAVRGALTGADWPWIMAALLASFPLHLADLVRTKAIGAEKGPQRTDRRGPF
ncbi:hypothetical protein [Sphingomonas sp.]